MKRIMMKQVLMKKVCCALAVSASLLVSACGSNDAQLSGTDTVEPLHPADSETANAADQTESGSEAVPDAGSYVENEADTDTATQVQDSGGITVSTADSPVTITMKTPDATALTDENGNLYYTAEYSYPVVSIEGNDGAAEKINADILSEMENVYAASDSMANDALEWLNSVVADGESVEDYFRAYSTSISYSAERADSCVISFTVYSYADMGGAHGNYSITGITYDTQTGDRLSFAELSDDPEAFRAATLSYNQALAETDAYSERMFTTDDITNGTLENVLYAEDTWYLSRAGLTFISNPYALGPYAAGAIEFIIPYRDLADMGFKQDCSYTGRMVMPLEEKQEWSVDLNGDGTQDTISLYNESTYHDDGTSGTVNHLTVNGTDHADTVAETMQAQVWAGLALYDLDTEDDYLDIALLVNYPEGDTYPPYSFFFRLEKDGSLTYLGRVKGYVTDPSVTFTELTVK